MGEIKQATLIWKGLLKKSEGGIRVPPTNVQQPGDDGVRRQDCRR
jgi:hypothetical protein